MNLHEQRQSLEEQSRLLSRDCDLSNPIAKRLDQPGDVINYDHQFHQKIVPCMDRDLCGGPWYKVCYTR
jgi:hypothetical protein